MKFQILVFFVFFESAIQFIDFDSFFRLPIDDFVDEVGSANYVGPIGEDEYHDEVTISPYYKGEI